jgi:ABC-type transport system involved in cytochrome c biogenesis permease subunit
MTPTEPNPPAPTNPAARPKGWWLPWVVLGIAAVYLLKSVGQMNPPSQPFDLAAFAQIPVADAGRVKPLETVARVDLRAVSQQEVFEDENGKEQPAILWYLDALAGGSAERHGRVWKYRVFQIANDQLVNDLKLERRPGHRYSLEELGPRIDVLREKAAAAQKKQRANKPLDTYEVKVLELAQRVELFINMSQARLNRERGVGALLLPPQNQGEEWQSLGEFRSKCRREAFQAAVDPIRKQFQPDPAKSLSAEQQTRLFDALLGPSAHQVPPEKRAQLIQNVFQADPAMLPEEDITEWLGAFAALSGNGTEAERQAFLDAYKADYDARVAANPAAAQWEKMIAAYRAGNATEFNRLVREYRDNYFGEVSQHDLMKVRLETTYDRFQPFLHCIGLYVLVFVLCALSWLGWTEQLRKSAFYLLYLTVILHTAALLVRMYVQGRPPVTNLYSSAVFIGWGCVCLGLVLEKLFPIGLGNLVASVLGLMTTILSHNLATGGDTLEMMQAVLDTNFWLATHVTTVTLGYTATFVAGFIGVAYVARMLATVIRDSFQTPGGQSLADLLVFGVAAAGLVAIPVMFGAILLNALGEVGVIAEAVAYPLGYLVVVAGFVYAITLLFLRASNDGVDAAGNPVAGTLPGPARFLAKLALDPGSGKKMAQMVYGVVCFATLLSFVGTVLGGIWADQSWGRFWGWDPKENGAVLIVLWNALILHARWAGLVKDRGIAVLAVVGNMITAWSWFGTNQLGIGLHAYGFDNRLAEGCRYFWLSQLVIIGVGTIPQRYWASATKRVPTSASTSAASAPAAPQPVTTPSSVTGPKPVVTAPAAPQPTANGHHAAPQPARGKGGKKKHGKRR